MTRFLLMLPVSLPALHIFPFCNQLRPRFSRANELILSQPVRTAAWRGRGAPWGVVYRVSLSRNPQRRKVSKGKAALGHLAPSPCCLRKSGQWCLKAPGFPGHTKKCCPWAVPMTWRVSGLPGGFGPSSAAETCCSTEPAAAQDALEPFKSCILRAMLGRRWFYFWKASVELHCPGASMLQNHDGDPSLPRDGLA